VKAIAIDVGHAYEAIAPGERREWLDTKQRSFNDCQRWHFPGSRIRLNRNERIGRALPVRTGISSSKGKIHPSEQRRIGPAQPAWQPRSSRTAVINPVLNPLQRFPPPT
jgi:hypothetical protein